MVYRIEKHTRDIVMAHREEAEPIETATCDNDDDAAKIIYQITEHSTRIDVTE